MEELLKPNFEIDVIAKINGISQIESNMEAVKDKAIQIKNYYENLIITEDMLPSIKEEKASISKAKTSVSDYRKNIIKEFKKPIEQFEALAKETEKTLSDAYDICNSQVKLYEDKIKEEKSLEIERYFNEYALSKEINFLSFKNSDIVVNLSSSIKKLKEEVKEYIDKVLNDLMLIDTQDNKIEILAEYKRTLNVSNAILTVKQRIEAEKIEREHQEQLAKVKVEQEKIVEKVDEVIAPKEIKQEPVQKILCMSFKVYGTLDQLKEVKYFLEEKGIGYDTN